MNRADCVAGADRSLCRCLAAAPPRPTIPARCSSPIGPWTKLCFKRADGNSDCFISAARARRVHPFRRWRLDLDSRWQKTLSLLVNFGDEASARKRDQCPDRSGHAIVISHPECFGLGCRGKIDITGEFIERLKRARTIAIAAIDTAHQKLNLSLFRSPVSPRPLTGPPAIHPRCATKRHERQDETSRSRRSRFNVRSSNRHSWRRKARTW